MMSEFKKQRAKHLCDVMKELSGIDPMDTSREQDVVTARMMVAVVLRNDGFTTKEIGTLLGRDHATILHYQDRWLALFMPGWEAERELWEKFKKAI